MLLAWWGSGLCCLGQGSCLQLHVETCTPAYFVLTQRGGQEVWWGVYPPRMQPKLPDHNLVESVKWEASSHYPQRVSWSWAPSSQIPVASRTRAEQKLLSAQAAQIRTGRASLTALQCPQIKSCRNGPQERNLIPQGRSSHCMTNAVMEEDRWKYMRNIFVWGGKQMRFLQLLQKTGMNSSLLICTAVPRNAAGQDS